jgi:hypothetical protein
MDDEKRSWKATDGKQTASLKVTELGGRETELIVKADVPDVEEEKKSEEELAFRVIDAVCNSLGVKYTVVKD